MLGQVKLKYLCKEISVKCGFVLLVVLSIVITLLYFSSFFYGTSFPYILNISGAQDESISYFDQKINQITVINGKSSENSSLPVILQNKKSSKEIPFYVNKVKNYINNSKKSISPDELSIWESKNEPLIIFQMSTWRSGSTFLAHVINSHPGIFQHYEPFHFVGVNQISTIDEEINAKNLLNDLFHCKFSNDKYLKSMRRISGDLLNHNPYVFNECRNKVEICLSKEYLSESCKQFPIHLVKSVRLRLNVTKNFMDNYSNIKVIYLVRDPRAIMSSRYSSVKWCENSKDCFEPSRLCSFMSRDLESAKLLQTNYGNNIKLIKYEDIALNPSEEINELFNFLGLELTEDTKNFVLSHTTKDDDKPWSTNRKSSVRVNVWESKLTKDQIINIQESCKDVMNELNYELITFK